MKELTKLGLKRGHSAGLVISGSIPVSALTQLHKLDSLHHISLSRINTRSGSVVSQGVTAMRADTAKIESGLDGSGVTVGVISDSYDCYAQSDNPESLVFLSGGNGIASVVNGIKTLVNEVEVDVIVDDSALGSETFFQDDLITQAIDQATEQGVSYVTAVGNSGRNAYQSIYRESKNSVLDINAHNFADDGNTDVFQKFSLPEGSTMNMILQWSEPAYSVSGSPGAQTDLDVSIVNSEGTRVIQSSKLKSMLRVVARHLDGQMRRMPYQLVQWTIEKHRLWEPRRQYYSIFPLQEEIHPFSSTRRGSD